MQSLTAPPIQVKGNCQSCGYPYADHSVLVYVHPDSNQPHRWLWCRGEFEPSHPSSDAVLEVEQMDSEGGNPGTEPRAEIPEG